MTIIARTQDFRRAKELFQKLQEEGVEVPEKFLDFAKAYGSRSV